MGYSEDIQKRYDKFNEAKHLVEPYSRLVYNYRVKTEKIESNIKFEDIDFNHSQAGLTIEFPGLSYWLDFPDIYVAIDPYRKTDTMSGVKAKYNEDIKTYESLINEGVQFTKKYEEVILIKLKLIDPNFSLNFVYDYGIIFNRYDIVVNFDDEEYIFDENELNNLVSEFGPITIEDIIS